MYYPSQRLLGALIVIEDVTELSALQEQVASSERHFAVGQMTAGLAHDFNNVLGTISQAVYVLEMAARDRSEADRTMLSIINNAVRRGAEIVNNIREYLRGHCEVRVARGHAPPSRRSAATGATPAGDASQITVNARRSRMPARFTPALRNFVACSPIWFSTRSMPCRKVGY